MDAVLVAREAVRRRVAERRDDDERYDRADDRSRRDPPPVDRTPLGAGDAHETASERRYAERDAGDDQEERGEARVGEPEVRRGGEVGLARAGLQDPERGEPRDDEDAAQRRLADQPEGARDDEELDEAQAPEDLAQVQQLVVQVTHV